MIEIAVSICLILFYFIFIMLIFPLYWVEKTIACGLDVVSTSKLARPFNINNSLQVIIPCTALVIGYIVIIWSILALYQLYFSAHVDGTSP